MSSRSQHSSDLRNRGSGTRLAHAKSDVDELQRAIVGAIAYSDIFDYPLTSEEVHRYLVGITADYPEVDAVLENGLLVPDRLSKRDEYFTLPGRQHIVDVRRERERRARQVWQQAERYGGFIARIPFIRMVAVTGELAVNNVRDTSDVDYFIVTEPGRLWLVRAMVIAIVKAAERTGITICPNYLITENALEISQQNLYTARELTQMVPLAGLDTYRRLLLTNRWTTEYLPNAGPNENGALDQSFDGAFRKASERVLRTSVIDHVERWEMNRKIQKFTREHEADILEHEAAFSSDWCKGHFDSHGRETLEAYEQRLRVVEELFQ